MLNTVHLYLRFLGVSMQSQMQYRVSFTLLTLGQFAVTAIEFLAILVLFDRLNSLDEWSLPEVAFFYGLVNIAFSIADAAAYGFDHFGNMVKSGDFDRLLLRPRSTALQLAGQELTLRRVGRLAQGLVILLWASAALDLGWTPAKVALIISAIAGGAALFTGLMVLQATLAFWATETLEIFAAVTHGGVQASQYPLAIYRPWFQKFFIYVVPLATVSYFPSLAIIERADPLGSTLLVQYLSPMAGFAFLVLSLQVWKFGVRHYQSTGS